MTNTIELKSIFRTELEQRLLENMSEVAIEASKENLVMLMEDYDASELTIENGLYPVIFGSIIDVIDEGNRQLQANTHYKKLLNVEKIDASFADKFEIKLNESEGMFSGGVKLEINIQLESNVTNVLLAFGLINELHVKIQEENIYCAEVYVNGALAEKF